MGGDMVLDNKIIKKNSFKNINVNKRLHFIVTLPVDGSSFDGTSL